MHNKNLKYVSPLIIAERKSNKDLQNVFSNDCLQGLTYKSYTLPQNVEDDGPFYVFQAGYPTPNDQNHFILMIYGLVSNPYKDAIIGKAHILSNARSCSQKNEISIFGWDFRKREDKSLKDKTVYGPTLAGFAYYDDQPLLYFLDGEKSANNSGWRFKFTWYLGEDQIANASVLSTPRAITFHTYPDNFDPFSIIFTSNPLKESTLLRSRR